MRRELLIALIVLGWAGSPSARTAPGHPADPDEGVQLVEATPPLFADTTDPDYQTMLQAVETGRKLMLATPEADMPGFKGARPEP